MSIKYPKGLCEYWNYTHQINKAYEDYAATQGLSSSSLYILMRIYINNKMTQKQLCETLFLPKQTVNTIVVGLVKEEILKIETSTKDKRTKEIEFTNEGLIYARKIFDPLFDAEALSMLELNEEEQAMFVETTKKYANSFSEKVVKNIKEMKE